MEGERIWRITPGFSLDISVQDHFSIKTNLHIQECLSVKINLSIQDHISTKINLLIQGRVSTKINLLIHHPVFSKISLSVNHSHSGHDLPNHWITGTGSTRNQGLLLIASDLLFSHIIYSLITWLSTIGANFTFTYLTIFWTGSGERETYYLSLDYGQLT